MGVVGEDGLRKPDRAIIRVGYFTDWFNPQILGASIVYCPDANA